MIELYAIHGTKWSTIARQIPGRTDDACSKRYREALDPNLKKDEWTPDEDAKLRLVYSQIGQRWKEVGHELQRSGLACRNRSKCLFFFLFVDLGCRWRLLERKQQHSDAVIPSHTEDLDPTTWPPYYPPEAYPGLVSSGHFRETTPGPVTLPSPDVAPFRFSSSSLSAALSAPARIHPPLPPESPFNEPDTFVSTSSSTSPSLFQNDSLDDFHDEQMLLEDSHKSSFIPYFFDGDNSFIDPSMGLMSPLEAISPQLIQDPSKMPILLHSPLQQINLYEDFSSASSSPFERGTSLSPASSPNTASPVDLPATEQPFQVSLLFSADFRSKPRSKSAPHRPTRLLGESRLSSVMPVTAECVLYLLSASQSLHS